MYMSGPGEYGHGRLHMVAVPYGDTGGPRVLALPGWAGRYFAMGLVVEDTPAVDQYGRGYRYDAAIDTWVPAGQRARMHPAVERYMAMAPFGARRRNRKRWRVGQGVARAGRRMLRKRRLIRKVVRRVTPIVQRAGRAVANVGGALARSKLVREAAAQAGQIVGIPAPATRMALKTAGEINRQTGGRLLSIARQDPRKALKIAARSAAASAPSALMPFSGAELEQNGGLFYAAPVQYLVGVDGVHAFGQLEVADTPTPGMWYRVKQGDSLLKVAGRAYQVSGGTRLARSKWINNVPENQVYWSPPKSDFNKKHYPDGIIVFNPKFACDTEAALRGESGKCYPVIYIPITEGDRPPTEPAEPIEVEPDLPSVLDEPPVEPAPPAPLPPSDEPIEPEPMEPTVVVDIPPTDVPAVPVEPVPAPEYPVAPPEPEPTPADLGPEIPEPPPVQPPPYTPGVPEPPRPSDPGYELPDYTVPTCPPGMAYSYQQGQCVAVEPDYTTPTCPPGMAYSYQLQQCMPVGQPPPPPPDFPPFQPTPPGAPGGSSLPLAAAVLALMFL